MVRSLINHVKENEKQFPPGARKVAEEFEKKLNPNMINAIANKYLKQEINLEALTYENIDSFEQRYPGLLSKLSK